MADGTARRSWITLVAYRIFPALLHRRFDLTMNQPDQIPYFFRCSKIHLPHHHPANSRNRPLLFAFHWRCAFKFVLRHNHMANTKFIRISFLGDKRKLGTLPSK